MGRDIGREGVEMLPPTVRTQVALSQLKAAGVPQAIFFFDQALCTWYQRAVVYI